MVFLFYVSLLLFMLCNAANAGIFGDEGSLDESRERAKHLNESIFAGKIIVTDPKTTKRHDYASAVPIGRPGDEQTRVVVSCAHAYTDSIDYGCVRQYCDYRGNLFDISTVKFCQADSHFFKVKEDIRLHAENDIVLYYLEKPVACNPLNDIARDFPQTVKLTSLTYGWALITPENNEGNVANLDGSWSFSLDNTFKYSQNTYVHDYDADRVVSLFDGEKHAVDYLAPHEITKSTSQVYYHDSGAPWFAPNQKGGYSFTALTSRTTPVFAGSTKEAEDMVEGLLTEKSFVDWQETHYTLRFVKLKKLRPFQVILTPLALHWDWILKQCSNFNESEL